MVHDGNFTFILELRQVRIFRKSGNAIFQNIGTFPPYRNRPNVQYITHEELSSFFRIYRIVRAHVFVPYIAMGKSRRRMRTQKKNMDKTPYTQVCVFSTVNAIPDKYPW